MFDIWSPVLPLSKYKLHYSLKRRKVDAKLIFIKTFIHD